MAPMDDGPPKDRPELRAPEGGKDRYYDRLIFLVKVQELRQPVLRDLYERALADSQREDDLAAWSETWNLADPWIVETARRSYEIYAKPATHQQRREQAVRLLNRPLRTRGDIPDGRGALRFDPDDLIPPYETLTWIGGLRDVVDNLTVDALRRAALLPTPAPPLEVRAPDPTVDNRRDYLELVRKAAEECWEDRRHDALNRGATERVRKRATLSDDPTLHVGWLVRWQIPPVKGATEERYEDIRRDPGPGIDKLASEKAVGRRVRETAARIGLTRRTEL